MRTIALSTLILSSPAATTAFHPTPPCSHTSTRLDYARRDEFPELDALAARRLAMMKGTDPTVDEDDHQEVAYEYQMPLEYYYDSEEQRGGDDAPFHVLLMPSTFDSRSTSIEDVASSCVQVLGLPYDDAYQLSMFARYEAFSVLGTWSRSKCIEIGQELRDMDVDCRLVPYEKSLEEWEVADFLPSYEDDSESDIEAELSEFTKLKRSHDQDLEVFMKKSSEEAEIKQSLDQEWEAFMTKVNDQQKDEHPDSFSLRS